MTKFNDKEFSLFEHIIEEIIFKKKKSKKEDFKNTLENGSESIDYVTEIFYQNILYNDNPFQFTFKKHFIDSNPNEKMEKSFSNRVNNIFNKDIFRVSFGTHAHNLRRNFQVVRTKATSSYDIRKTKIWNKEPIVMGISIQAFSGSYPINFYPPEYQDDDVDYRNCTIYVQTNNIKKAQINVDKYFINLMIKAMDNKLDIDNKYIKKRLKEIKKRKEK